MFQAMSDLEELDELSTEEQAQYDEVYNWFRANLRKPRSFSRSSKPHAKNVAISWFRDTAAEHIAKICPRLHHLATLSQVPCPVVCAPQRIAHRVSQLELDEVRSESQVLVENGPCDGANP